jgi:Spy/CpxP family protein refolding chaperone
MKRKLITLATVCAVALTTISMAQAQDPTSKGPRWRGHGKGNMLEHLTKAFNLTPDQQAKIQPILDQAKPQVVAIRQDARQKIKAIRENARTQIRAVLTPDQQQKFDAFQKAREDMRKAREEMRDAGKQ